MIFALGALIDKTPCPAIEYIEATPYIPNYQHPIGLWKAPGARQWTGPTLILNLSLRNRSRARIEIRQPTIHYSPILISIEDTEQNYDSPRRYRLR